MNAVDRGQCFEVIVQLPCVLIEDNEVYFVVEGRNADYMSLVLCL